MAERTRGVLILHRHDPELHDTELLRFHDSSTTVATLGVMMARRCAAEAELDQGTVRAVDVSCQLTRSI